MSVLNAAKTLGQASGWSLSNLTMQKTLYIAQLLHLGRTGRPAFSEPFEAWDYGPVVPVLYRAAKTYKSGPVKDSFETLPFDKGSSEFQAICDAYFATRHMSSGQLVTYTHRQGGAWEKHYCQGMTGCAIPVEAMLEEAERNSVPSDAAVAWAESVAAGLEEGATRYLDDQDERAFRARILRADLH